MPVVWSDRHRLHDPGAEVFVGVRTPGTELPERAERIRSALAERGATLVDAWPQPDDALTSVHAPELIRHLAGLWSEWEAAGLPDDPGQDEAVPYLFPHPDLFSGRSARTATAITARAGQFAYDTMTLVGPGTWEAARAAFEAAVTAADIVAGGAPAAYACVRPPGHHATRAAFGGSCYLNNSAAAAARLRAEGHAPVAVIDIDAHHGNGTQAIFWEDDDVLTGSVHVDPAAGWFPHYLGFEDERGERDSNSNVVMPPGAATTPGSRRWRGLPPGPRSGVPRRWWYRSAWMPARATPRLRWPSRPPASARRDARSGRSRCPPSSYRRAATTWRRSGSSCASCWRGSRRGWMAEGRSMWVGKDEHQGVRAQPRKDLRPPPHWRLEAVARTPRPRSLTMGKDRRSATFIEDRQTSDVWLVDLVAGSAPERLTTGRDPMPYWEDSSPQLSPDGSTVAYADDGHVWLVPTAGGPPRKLAEGDNPRWIDGARLVISVERDDATTTRLAVVNVDDPWPRRLAVSHGELDAHGDEGEAVPSPDGTEVAYTFTPRADQSRSSEIRVAAVEGGAVRRLTGVPDMHDGEPAWAPDGETIAYTSERSGFHELHLVGSDGANDRQLTSAGADHAQHEWHPDGTRLVAVRGERNRFHLVVVDASDGSAELLARGGTWSTPALDGGRRAGGELRGPRQAAGAAAAHAGR